jgi:PAS domain S-box-containing protein
VVDSQELGFFFTSLSIGTTVIVAFLFIDWMVLAPVRLLYEKLLSISAQRGVPQKSVNISKELNRLDEAICQMGETMALIKTREKELLATTISRDYMDKIIQGISDALFVVDSHAVIKMVNGAACDLLGYEREELEGAPFSRIVTEGGFVENKLLNPSSGSIKNCEIGYVRKDGQKILMYFSSSTVFDPNHRGRDIVCIAKDITERKRFENELKTLNQELMDNEKTLSKMISDLQKAHADLKKAQTQILHSEKLASIGQLAAGVAHEINNPLGFIISNMKILQEYIQGYIKILRVIDDLKTYITAGDVEKTRLTVDGLKGLEEEINLDYIRNDINTLLEDSMLGLQRIRKIVTDLRTFARDEQAERMEMAKIEEVIDSVLSIVLNEIKYKADLIKEFTNTPPVKCNPQRLGQVFVNLLINASQASDKKGTIHIKTYQQDKYVCVDIVDTGRGISPEHVQRIFDPFFTTKPVGRGTGLGLSISYEIIKKHGGEMKVQSRVGEGTTFTVMLPAVS